jgi:hypothetical protein
VPDDPKSTSDSPDETSQHALFDRLRAHYRECERKAVEVRAEIEVVSENGKVLDTGTAIITNISPIGALLSRIETTSNSFPVGPFQINVRMQSGGFSGIGFRCSPVRFVPEQNGIGVVFDEIHTAF